MVASRQLIINVSKLKSIYQSIRYIKSPQIQTQIPPVIHSQGWQLSSKGLPKQLRLHDLPKRAVMDPGGPQEGENDIKGGLKLMDRNMMRDKAEQGHERP